MLQKASYTAPDKNGTRKKESAWIMMARQEGWMGMVEQKCIDYVTAGSPIEGSGQNRTVGKKAIQGQRRH